MARYKTQAPTKKSHKLLFHKQEAPGKATTTLRQSKQGCCISLKSKKRTDI
jgi:hypothetical protein